jgi:chemotaxis protein methyltransferase CheR
MNEIEFSYLRDLLHKRSGLSIGVDKRYLVESRLAVVCRQNGIASLSTLTGLLRAGAEGVATAVIEAMTTNETLFFRDTLPFRHVRELMLPHLMKARSTDRTLRIWCAAASSGQEPYSLAMMLDEMASQLKGWKIEILATDISEDILAKARAGIYSQFEVQRGLPIQSLLRHFTQRGERWHLSERIRNMVTFRQHNLVSQQSGSGPVGRFDIIFCRNVMIYFDVPTKSRVLDLLARHIRPDGFLCLGGDRDRPERCLHRQPQQPRCLPACRRQGREPADRLPPCVARHRRDGPWPAGTPGAGALRVSSGPVPGWWQPEQHIGQARHTPPGPRWPHRQTSHPHTKSPAWSGALCSLRMSRSR